MRACESIGRPPRGNESTAALFIASCTPASEIIGGGGINSALSGHRLPVSRVVRVYGRQLDGPCGRLSRRKNGDGALLIPPGRCGERSMRAQRDPRRPLIGRRPNSAVVPRLHTRANAPLSRRGGSGAIRVGAVACFRQRPIHAPIQTRGNDSPRIDLFANRPAANRQLPRDGP